MSSIITEIVKGSILTAISTTSKYSNLIPYRIPHFIPYDNSAEIGLINTEIKKKSIVIEIV